MEGVPQEVIMTEQDIRDYIRSRLQPKIVPTLATLKKTQWSHIFETLMRNRLIMGAVRYETIQDKRNANHRYDLVGSAIKRLEKYQKDGNCEHLADAANCCLLEFEAPSNPKAHWNPVDDGEHVKKK
jgi:hypothetical protein